MSTILVVDDEIPFLKMMDVNLRRRGCHVLAVTTCDEALIRAACRQRCDAKSSATGEHTHRAHCHRPGVLPDPR